MDDEHLWPGKRLLNHSRPICQSVDHWVGPFLPCSFLLPPSPTKAIVSYWYPWQIKACCENLLFLNTFLLPSSSQCRQLKPGTEQVEFCCLSLKAIKRDGEWLSFSWTNWVQRLSSWHHIFNYIRNFKHVFVLALYVGDRFTGVQGEGICGLQKSWTESTTTTSAVEF